MNELSPKAKWVAILLAFYVHGLTFYFALSGIAGVHTTILTAIFQICLVAIPFILIVLTRAPRARFLHIGMVELSYLAFVAMFLYDFVSTPNKAIFPENLIIYFGVYWTALSLMRSLTFAQFRLLCPISSAIAVLTSLILLAQVLTGTAQWADNGSRLVAGTSGNPILVGYTGAYAFLSCVVMWLTGRYAGNPILLALALPGFLVCSFSGTRSATLSIMFSGAFVTLYAVNLLMASNKSTIKLISNLALYLSLGVGSLLLLSPLSSAAGQSKGEASPIERALNTGLQRIDVLFQIVGGGGSDMSIEGREKLYGHAVELFLQKPIWGNGLYTAGSAHNAFLQVATEFGMFGIIAFAVPFVYLGIRVMTVVLSVSNQCKIARQTPARFVKSDYAMTTCFTVVFLFQAICIFSFHGDPYRNYLPVASIGLMLAFLRFSPREIQTLSSPR
jgi:O-antigen ligase